MREALSPKAVQATTASKKIETIFLKFRLEAIVISHSPDFDGDAAMFARAFENFLRPRLLRQDVWMIERRRDFYFLLKAPQPVGIFRKVSGHDFDGDFAYPACAELIGKTLAV
ncbi:MAG TPA: hypothetical protein PLD20_33500 [Blastocatellia bacterium]|nr:hypothetical protein [Blastocatellia bacterium]HMV82365.1 hypothetical protein [Blastocatellia bacterium]HMX28577.1 hypothetical protein [Blastocatellia bacterium]HMY75359.1 hypothetical protein [Blastocatellia bacterium]HMZ22889.1 hypothetical protein [Blastocatellia bacterium]